MIRVLIAEDEPPILRRIAEMVERLDPNFRVVATAMNGQLALQQMAETEIDVVFTDIRMPVMDGLALMDRIRADYPECIVVVLSGYSDFDYMSHAMRANSMDYLLKPVMAEDLLELLMRIRQQVSRRNQDQLKRRLALQLNKSEAGVPGSMDRESTLGICLFCAGAFPFHEDAEMYPSASFWNEEPLDAAAKELSPGFMDFIWEFMGNTPVERILIFQPTSPAYVEWVQLLHEKLQSADTPVSCICLNRLIPLEETSQALKTLRLIMGQSMELGRGIFVAAEAPIPAISPAFDKTQMRQWAMAFGTGRTGQEGDLVGAFVRQVERERWTQRSILDFLMGVAAQMPYALGEDRTESVQDYQTVLREAVCTSLTLGDLEEKLRSLIPSAEAVQPEENMRQAKVVDRIEQYLQGHYAEHITNQTLASVFGYVPSYLSLLFRQRYKLSPSEYLTGVRMERAKELMQTQPELLIREVAEKVGFKSQHHFSRTFKKNEGVWPTSFR
jgi:DNA-binding NarL/FixJ family response regulator/AraC-like DNA-binding protein